MIVLMPTNILSREFLGVPLLEEGYPLVISIVVQSMTFLGIRLYLNRKGDM